jgi:hypothetical protein
VRQCQQHSDGIKIRPIRSPKTSFSPAFSSPIKNFFHPNLTLISSTLQDKYKINTKLFQNKFARYRNKPYLCAVLFHFFVSKMELMIATHHRLVAKFAASRCTTNRIGILPLMPLLPARISSPTARPHLTSSTPDFYHNSCCNEGHVLLNSLTGGGN